MPAPPRGESSDSADSKAGQMFVLINSILPGEPWPAGTRHARPAADHSQLQPCRALTGTRDAYAVIRENISAVCPLLRQIYIQHHHRPRQHSLIDRHTRARSSKLEALSSTEHRRQCTTRPRPRAGSVSGYHLFACISHCAVHASQVGEYYHCRVRYHTYYCYKLEMHTILATMQ